MRVACSYLHKSSKLHKRSFTKSVMADRAVNIAVWSSTAIMRGLFPWEGATDQSAVRWGAAVYSLGI